MDNLMDKVQEMLSDPESMKQIQELANMLTSEMNNTQTSQTQQSSDNSNNTTQRSSNSDIPPNNDIFSNLFGNNNDTSTTNNNNNNNNASNSNDGNIDFGMIFQLMQLFNSTSNSQDEKLLLAIKPYLTTERQSKVDKAIKLMKIYEIFIKAKESGLLNNLDNLI